MHHSSIANLLSRLGFTYKKSRWSRARRRATVRQQRGDWFKQRLPAISEMPGRIVFIDGKEDKKKPRWGVFPTHAVKTHLTRPGGRSRRGARLTMDAPFGSWGTQTLIAGLTQDALIAPSVIKGPMDGPAFAGDIRDVLVPEIAPGTVVILDNLAPHLNEHAAQA